MNNLSMTTDLGTDTREWRISGVLVLSVPDPTAELGHKITQALNHMFTEGERAKEQEIISQFNGRTMV